MTSAAVAAAIFHHHEQQATFLHFATTISLYTLYNHITDHSTTNYIHTNPIQTLNCSHAQHHNIFCRRKKQNTTNTNNNSQHHQKQVTPHVLTINTLQGAPVDE